MRQIARVLLLTLLVGSAPAARSESVDEVLSKYLAWRGGPSFEALQSLHVSGHLRVGEVDGTFERWMGRDGRLRENRVLGPLVDSKAVTPKMSWATNASGQVEEQGDGGQDDRRALTLTFAEFGKPHSKTSLRLLPSEQDEGRAWAVVRVSFGDNDSYDLFIDATSGELGGERITEDRAVRFVRYRDWRTVSGIRVAFEERVTASDPGGNETRRLTQVTANTPLTADLFEAPKPRRTWAFAAGVSSTGWIPFEFFNEEQIFIPATVNGHAVDFVLDSGADITILDKATAGTIGAKLSGALPIGGSGGQSTMQLTPDVQVRIGALDLKGITAGVMDLSEIAGQLGHPMPMIMGKEVFNQLIVDIDFPNRRIAFHDPAHFAAPAGAMRVAIARHRENRTVAVSVEGREPVDFDFDLGSNSPLIIYPYYRDKMRLLDTRKHSQELSAGVGGMFRPAIATLKSIDIGGLRIADVPADFPEPADSALNSDRMGGNIGLPVFVRLRLITDYPSNALWLVRDANVAAQAFLKNRAGVIALPAGDKLKVLMVAPGSPAEKSGWKEGMEIAAVDGHKIDSGYRKSTWSHWATQPAGTRVALRLTDGSTKELVLADYF